jgi:hypothetical protein
MKNNHCWLSRFKKRRKCGSVIVNFKELLYFIKERGAEILLLYGMNFLKDLVADELMKIRSPIATGNIIFTALK